MGVYIIYYVVITILFALLIKYKFKFLMGQRYANQKMMNQMKRQLIFFMVIATVLLITIIGLRADHQGLDLYNSLGTGYFFVYNIINKDSFIEIFRNFSSKKYANFEIGFVLFCKCLGILCNNKQIMLIGCAALSIACVGYFIMKHSSNKWLSIVLFAAMPCFTTTLFSAIRQGCALGIVMVSYGCVKERKPVSFVLLIALAAAFHSSAIVALAAYPAYYFIIDRKSALIGGLGALAGIYLMKEPLFWILAKIVHDSPRLYKNNSLNLFLILSLVYALCVLFCRDSDYEVRGYTNIFWLACAAQAFSSLHNLASRITWYFMMILIVLIPNLLNNMNIKEKQIIKPLSWLLGIGAVGLGLYYLRYNSMAKAYPYRLFWKA